MDSDDVSVTCVWPNCKCWARGGGYCKFHFFEAANYGVPCAKCGGVDCPDAEVGLVFRWKGIEMPALVRCACGSAVEPS